MTLREPLMRLKSIFLANDSFVFENRVTQREPGMADSQNRGCSSEREFAFRGQGFAAAEVCHALLESDHDQPPSSPEIVEPIRRHLGITNRVLDVAMAQVGLQCP